MIETNRGYQFREPGEKEMETIHKFNDGFHYVEVCKSGYVHDIQISVFVVPCRNNEQPDGWDELDKELQKAYESRAMVDTWAYGDYAEFMGRRRTY
jgi:hypothetical protein